jgi:lysozyme family protein
MFEKCIEVILRNEGGFQKNPIDSGNWVGGYKTGKLVGTKYGIAAKFFPDEDIKNLTIERAKELYKERYWNKMGLYGIDNEIALHIFDFGVNSGPRTAIKKAQRLAGTLADGVFGNMTMKAINNYDGDFLEDYKDVRRNYYRYLADRRPSQNVLLKGWLNRVEHTHF